MTVVPALDVDAIRRACERHGVARLRIFGSAVDPLRFNPETSDIDFLVDFHPNNENLLVDYFDLKEELERITGRPVDLITSRSIKNPYFKQSALTSAQELYAPSG